MHRVAKHEFDPAYFRTNAGKMRPLDDIRCLFEYGDMRYAWVQTQPTLWHPLRAQSVYVQRVVDILHAILRYRSEVESSRLVDELYPEFLEGTKREIIVAAVKLAASHADPLLQSDTHSLEVADFQFNEDRSLIRCISTRHRKADPPLYDMLRAYFSFVLSWQLRDGTLWRPPLRNGAMLADLRRVMHGHYNERKLQALLWPISQMQTLAVHDYVRELESISVQRLFQPVPELWFALRREAVPLIAQHSWLTTDQLVLQLQLLGEPDFESLSSVALRKELKLLLDNDRSVIGFLDTKRFSEFTEFLETARFFKRENSHRAHALERLGRAEFELQHQLYFKKACERASHHAQYNYASLLRVYDRFGTTAQLEAILRAVTRPALPGKLELVRDIVCEVLSENEAPFTRLKRSVAARIRLAEVGGSRIRVANRSRYSELDGQLKLVLSLHAALFEEDCERFRLSETGKAHIRSKYSANTQCCEEMLSVLQFLNKAPNKCFIAKEVAREVGLSHHTVCKLFTQDHSLAYFQRLCIHLQHENNMLYRISVSGRNCLRRRLGKC
jgi:hypothetical protein